MNRLETRGANVKWNKEENSKKINSYVRPKAKASLVAREAKICFQTSRISQWLVLMGGKVGKRRGWWMRCFYSVEQERKKNVAFLTIQNPFLL